MGEKVIIGNISKGLRKDVTPFNVDNDNFPVLQNAYVWRQRVKRKRGTEPFTRFNLQTTSTSNAAPPTSIQIGQVGTLSGAGTVTSNLIASSITNITQAASAVITLTYSVFLVGSEVTISGVTGMTQINGLTGTILSRNIAANTITVDINSSAFTAYSAAGTATLTNFKGIRPESIRLSDGTNIYTEPSPPTGVLVGAPAGSGTINYASGAITITGGALSVPLIGNFSYFPGLPALGLEPFVLDNTAFPLEVGFDTTYSYNISLSIGTQNLAFSPYQSWNVSYYANPASASINGNAYTQKSSWTAVNWNLATYQQIWTTNYQGAMWTTPGIRSSFDPADSGIGMQFKRCATVVYGGNQFTLTITITEASASLVIGDWVFINEVLTGGVDAPRVNLQTGFVTASSNGAGTTTLTVVFPYANIANVAYTAGILQYLTASSDTTKDCIRWYNGIPVSGTNPPVFAFEKGWVNFMPPLTSNNIGTFSIAQLPPSTTPYYLVGAKMIVPFKDRLLFFGPVVQTSSISNSNPVYLPDTIIYSQNGTAYYTASFDASVNAPPSPLVAYHALLVPSLLLTSPTSQTAQPVSFWENITGFGGFISAGYARPITTVSINEDALIVGLTDRQTRVLYTGNDIVPFNFYVINSELGSDSTFSSITLDRGVITMGGRGIILTSQTASERIDLDIPDEIFRIDLAHSGSNRICAQRDFINEWIYFTYPYLGSYNIYPNVTLQYNYREGSWAQFFESYTTYGTVRPLNGYIWSTLPYNSWFEWSDPWNSGTTNERQPQVIAGNAQGFVVLKANSTDESPSAAIESISGNIVTSTNHMLSQGDFIEISDCLGTVGYILNGKIFEVGGVTPNTFEIVEPPVISGTYLGNGLITRFYKPMIQTKEFNPSWGMSRKTRIGVQQYLFSYTPDAQITILIYLSQSETTPSNDSPIVPDPQSINNGLIYSTIMYTCPESTNLGLTPANINLQMVTAQQQQQIWHRMNTSLIGDTVQVGFTLSDAQMRSYVESLVSYGITAITNALPCVVTTQGEFAVDSLVKIQDVNGMTQINFVDILYNYYLVVSSTPLGGGLFAIGLNVDSTTFGVFSSSPNATITQVSNPNPTAEIEFHGAVIDINPSQLLA